jgi:O-antigen/teichoic acid export membrane protein
MAQSVQAAGPRTWRQVGLPFLILRVAGQAGEFAGFVVLARALAPQAFGRLSVVFLVARYLGLVGDWGASVRGARDVARGDDRATVDALLRRRLHVSLALTVAFAAVTTAVAGWALALLACVVLARGLNRDWLSLGHERGIASGVGSVAQGGGLLVFALLGDTPGQAAAAVSAAYVLGLAVSLAVNRRPRQPADARARDVGVDGWILGAVLADQVTISADTFLLAALRSASAAGIYAAVYRIPNAWMTLLGLAVLGMLAPTTRRVGAASRDDLVAVYRRAVRVGATTAGVVLLSILPSVVFVTLAFGHAYDRGRTPLCVLLVATALMAVSASLHPLFFALARDRDIFVLSLGGAVVNVAANLIAIPLWGITGAAGATLLAQAFLLGVIVVRLRRLIG